MAWRSARRQRKRARPPDLIPPGLFGDGVGLSFPWLPALRFCDSSMTESGPGVAGAAAGGAGGAGRVAALGAAHGAVRRAARLWHAVAPGARRCPGRAGSGLAGGATDDGGAAILHRHSPDDRQFRGRGGRGPGGHAGGQYRHGADRLRPKLSCLRLGACLRAGRRCRRIWPSTC